jgi:hypothetical protein
VVHIVNDDGANDDEDFTITSTLSAAAPNDCQGVTFTITIDFTISSRIR